MLSGTLDTFSAGELLWLLGRSQVTGVLRIHSAARAFVWCRDGFVTWAAVEGAYDVLDLLAASGYVQPGLDPTAAADQVDAELRNGANAQRIHDLVRTATEEAVFEMAAWAAGDITFETTDPHRFGHTFCYPVVAVLDAVRRRRARWAELVECIGGADRVVVQAPVSAGDDDLTISRSQWRLLGSVDGQRDILQLARATGLGLFAAAEMVADLVGAGLVAVVDPGEARFEQVAPPPRMTVPEAPTHNGRHLTAVPSGPTFAEAESFVLTAEAPDETPGLVALARELGLPEADYVNAGDKPSRDLILRLLSAVKEI